MRDFYHTQIEAREDVIKTLRLQELDLKRQKQLMKAKQQKAENVYNIYPYTEGENFKCICRRWMSLVEAVSVSRDAMPEEQWYKIPSVAYKENRNLRIRPFDAIVCMQCSIACERCERMFLLKDSLEYGLCFACNKHFLKP